MRPDRLAPFPLLDHIGQGLMDQLADMGQFFPAPVGQIGNALVNQFCRRGACGQIGRAVL